MYLICFQYIDSYWDGNAIECSSTLGYALILGFVPIYRYRKKQSTISLSLIEVEYKGVVNVTTQAILLQHFLTDFGVLFH
jgi:hypothetical protein